MKGLADNDVRTRDGHCAARLLNPTPPTPRGSGEDVKWFRGGLVCKAHKFLYHSKLGLTEINEVERGSGLGGFLKRGGKPPW